MVLLKRILVLAAMLLSACATVPDPPLPTCGAFSFTPRTDSNTTGQAALFQLNFAHSPRACPVSCGNYWFVQVLRELDLETGEYRQPNDTQKGRIVTGQADEYFNGWAVDRPEGRRLGWYHMTDDFRLEPASGLTGEEFQLGLASTPAKMHDTLARGAQWAGKRIQIVGLTAAVGLDPGTACENKVLGIKKWMTVLGHDDATNADTVSKPVELSSGQREMQAFLLAIDAWNNHLGGGRVRLPWASGPGFTLP